MSTKQAVWTSQSEDARTAWQRQVIEAAGDPQLAAVVNARQTDLWPRFAAHYQRLRALPRRLRRALKRKLPVSLAGAALLLALGQGEALAATIVVDGTTCMLVDAIIAANTDTGTGGCSAGSGADTLDLRADVTLTSSYASVYYNDTGLPLITSEITITGNCTGNPANRCTIERDSGAVDFRLLAVGTSGNLTLDNLTLSGGISDFGGGGVLNEYGTLTITHSTLSGNSAGFFGGGVSNYYYGTTTIANSIVSGNSAGFDGGGVTNFYGAITITHSTLSGNSGNFGGGVSNIYGTANIANSIISDNSTDSFGIGGGVANRYGTTTITNSTLSGNSSDLGGGVFNEFGTLTIAHSTLSSNSTGYDGGGVFNGSDSTATITYSTLMGNSANLGGGVKNGYPDSILSIINSTLSGNVATIGPFKGFGGGIHHFDGLVTIINSTLFGNSAESGVGGGVLSDFGTLTIAGNLITGNTATFGAEIANFASTIVNHHNLLGHSGITTAAAFDGFTPSASDINTTSDAGNIPLLGILNPTLAANGGPTLTHALISGSPALDAVPLDGGGTGCVTTDPDGNPLTTDQRGVSRPQGTGCDIGAFEFGETPPSSAPDCALLGDQSVSLGNGTVVREGSAAARVCGNAAVTLGANVQVLDGGGIQQAYDSGSRAGQVRLTSGAQVTGSVLANGNLKLGTNNRVGGDAQAGLDLTFSSHGNTVAGECRYGGLLINSGVFGNSCGSATLQPTPPFADAFALPDCTVSAPGGADIAPPANTNQGLLPAGDYGHVRFGNGATVELKGDYTFKSLAFGYNNHIQISGPSTLQVEQRLTFGNGTREILSGGTTAADVVYLVHSGMTVYSQSAGANTVLYGTICAPQATITLGSGTRFEGAVYADSISFGFNVDFTTSQAPLP